MNTIGEPMDFGKTKVNHFTTFSQLSAKPKHNKKRLAILLI
jgi:hypothetical protein